MEVVRGCANLCRFCWAGYNYLPVRAFPADRILEIAGPHAPHASRVGLVSIALCDHPEIERLLAGLLAMGYSISPASLRLDDLTEPIVRMLRESGERSITIAPETGSDRLRRVINKTMTNDEILDRADLIFRSGIENLKLYFMIGLPTETDEDLAAIRDLSIAHQGAHAGARPAARTTRAHQRQREPARAEARARPTSGCRWRRRTRSSGRSSGCGRSIAGIDNVYFSIKSERHSFYQALLSLGDRRVAPVIVAAERNGGQWRAAAAEAGVDPAFYVYRDRSNDAVLPWDIIDGGAQVGLLPRRVREGPARRMDDAVEARRREHPPAADGPVTAATMHG